MSATSAAAAAAAPASVKREANFSLEGAASSYKKLQFSDESQSGGRRVTTLESIPTDLWDSRILPFIRKTSIYLGAPFTSLCIKEFVVLRVVSKTFNYNIAYHNRRNINFLVNSYRSEFDKMKKTAVSSEKTLFEKTEEILNQALKPSAISRTILMTTESKIAQLWGINNRSELDTKIEMLKKLRLEKFDIYRIFLRMIDSFHPNFFDLKFVYENFAAKRALRRYVGISSWLLLRPDKDGITIAHTAARWSLEALQWMWTQSELKPLLFKLNNAGATIAHSATSQKRLATLQWMLTEAALKPLLLKPNNAGATIAHLVTDYFGTDNESLDILQWIMNQPELKHLLFELDGNGRTIAHWAATKMRLRILKWIMAKAELKHLLLSEDNNGYTITFDGEHLATLEILQWMLTEPELQPLLFELDDSGYTIAHTAAFTWDTNTFHWMITEPELKPLLFELDDSGRTIAHVEAASGGYGIVWWMLTQPELKPLLFKLDNSRCTIAHFAAGNENLTVLYWMLTEPELKPLLFKLDANGRTIAHFAAGNSSLKVLKWMMTKPELKPLLFKLDANGRTIALQAAANRALEILSWMLTQPELKPLLFELDANGRTMAHLAAANGDQQILSWMINSPELKPLLSKLDANGRTIADLADHQHLSDWIKANVKFPADSQGERIKKQNLSSPPIPSHKSLNSAPSPVGLEYQAILALKAAGSGGRDQATANPTFGRLPPADSDVKMRG